MLTSILSKAIVGIFWPLGTKILVSSGAPQVWTKCFKNAGKPLGVSAATAESFSKLPAIKRLLQNTFRADRRVPSASDFAVTLAFEIFQKDYDFLDDLSLTPSTLRHWATNIRREWITTIIESPILKARFKETRDKHPAAFISTDASCMPEFDSILENKFSLFSSYYESYSTQDANETVYVWLPDSDGATSIGSSDSIPVPVTLNTSLGVDRGFFRIGFDYSLGSNECIKHLNVCFLNQETFMESAQFDGIYIGKLTEDILWIR